MQQKQDIDWQGHYASRLKQARARMLVSQSPKKAHLRARSVPRRVYNEAPGPVQPVGPRRVYNSPIGPQRGVAAFPDVLAITAYCHGISPEDITGVSRRHIHVHPRQEMCWRLSLMGLSSGMIGARIGGRDHTTVLDAIRAHERRVKRREARA